MAYFMSTPTKGDTKTSLYIDIEEQQRHPDLSLKISVDIFLRLILPRFPFFKHKLNVRRYNMAGGTIA